MPSTEYVSPKTALAYLLRSGLHKRAAAAYCGITPLTLYRILQAPEGAAFRGDTAKKLHEAYERRRSEMACDARIRKELGL